MGRDNFKFVFSLSFGILSIIYAPSASVLGNILNSTHLYYLGLVLGFIFGIAGLFFSRYHVKGNDHHNQNLKTLAFTGKIFNIIGLCVNFVCYFPIIWFALCGFG